MKLLGHEAWQAESLQEKPATISVWILGVLLGLLVTGGVATSGALLNLDLVAIADLDVPRELFGVGPEAPRRAPLNVVFALVSPPLAAVTVVHLWMVAIVAVAFVAMVSALRPLSAPIRMGSGVLWALSPLLLTRLGVGHLAFASAVAALPVAMPVLLHPSDRPRRTILVLAAYAMLGYFGFLVVAPVLVVGALTWRRVPAWRELAVLILTQLPWLLPAATVVGRASGAADSSRFETDIDEVADLLRLPLGFGFWQRANQVGSPGLLAVALALALTSVAVVGFIWGRVDDRRAVVWLAAVGLLATVSSITPGLDRGYAVFTDTVLFAPIREGQRLVVFVVFAVIVGAAHGLQAAMAAPGRGRAIAAAGVVVLALVALLRDDLGGLDGRVRSVSVPAAWSEVVDIVEAEPGTSVALPWVQYFDVVAADGRRGHHPLPRLLPGDVIAPHDLGFGERDQVRDDRETEVRDILASLRLGLPIDDRLDALGARWFVALPDALASDIELLRDSPQLTVVVDDLAVVLFEWADWDGERHPIDNRWSWWATLIAVANVIWALTIASQIRRDRERST